MNDPSAERLFELCVGLQLIGEGLKAERARINQRDVRTAPLACTAVRAALMQIEATRERKFPDPQGKWTKTKPKAPPKRARAKAKK